MIKTMTAKDLKVGDVLSTSGAKITQTVPSHHGTKVYLATEFEDGYTQTVTTDAETVVHVWTPDE